MRRLLAVIACAVARRWAPDEVDAWWRLGYDAGYAEGRRVGVRAIFPRATDGQLDRMLAMKGREN